jgi:hypothetical protein
MGKTCALVMTVDENVSIEIIFNYNMEVTEQAGVVAVT